MTEKSALKRCNMGEQNFDDEEVEVENIQSKDMRETVFMWGGLFFLAFLLAIIAFGLSSCTITQTMVHTEGQDSGDVSESATTSPNVQPSTNLTVPVKAI
jgi:hypothetical protein